MPQQKVFFSDAARVVDFFSPFIVRFFVGARVFSFVLVHRFHHEISNTSIVLAILYIVMGFDYVYRQMRACGFTR